MTQISKRALDKKRQNRRQIAWTAAIVTILVLAMTWYDLNLRDYSHAYRAASRDYYITAADTLPLLPDDYSGVTLWHSRLTVAADGTVAASEASIQPQALPQRQIDLVIALPRLPDAAVEGKLIDHIAGIVEDWTADNNLVTEIILDVREMTAPPRALQGFVQRLRERLEMGYRVGLLFDPAGQSDPVMQAEAAALSDLLSTLAGLYFYLPATDVVTAFDGAEKLAFPFTVIIPPGSSDATAPDDVYGTYKYFRKFIYPLDEKATTE